VDFDLRKTVTQNPIGHGRRANTTRGVTFLHSNTNHTTNNGYADKLADNNIRKKAAPGPRERAAIKARYEEILSDPNFRPRSDFPVGRQKFVEFVNEHFGEGPLPPPHLQVLRESNTGALRDRITGVETPGEQLASRISGIATPGEQLAARITGVETPGEQLAARITGTATPGEQLAARITSRTLQTPGEQLAARISTAPTKQAGKKAHGGQGNRLNERGGIKKYHHNGSR
jgi:hypothetical protein